MSKAVQLAYPIHSQANEHGLNLSSELHISHSHAPTPTYTVWQPHLFVGLSWDPGPWCTLIFWLLQPALHSFICFYGMYLLILFFFQAKRNRIKQVLKSNYNDSNLGLNWLYNVMPICAISNTDAETSQECCVFHQLGERWTRARHCVNEIRDLAKAYVSLHLNNSVRIWPFC